MCAFPTIEICGTDLINYMVPLSRQTDFFVPEMKEEVKTDVKEEDSDEDRGTDITGDTVYFVHSSQALLNIIQCTKQNVNLFTSLKTPFLKMLKADDSRFLCCVVLFCFCNLMKRAD